MILGGYREVDKLNYSRECKRIIKSALEVERIELFGNINKINEILEGIGYKKVVLNITKNTKKELEKHY